MGAILMILLFMGLGVLGGAMGLGFWGVVLLFVVVIFLFESGSSDSSSNPPSKPDQDSKDSGIHLDLKKDDPRKP